MAERMEFEVEPEFFEQTVDELADRTEYGREEVRRGLLFMVGRRTAGLFQSLTDEKSNDLLRELEIAIIHSGQEK